MVWFVEDENGTVAMITNTKEAAIEYADFESDYGEFQIYQRDVFNKEDVTRYCENRKMKKGYNHNARYNLDMEVEEEKIYA